jgi:hypothetical protein
MALRSREQIGPPGLGLDAMLGMMGMSDASDDGDLPAPSTQPEGGQPEGATSWSGLGMTAPEEAMPLPPELLQGAKKAPAHAALLSAGRSVSSSQSRSYSAPSAKLMAPPGAGLEDPAAPEGAIPQVVIDRQILARQSNTGERAVAVEPKETRIVQEYDVADSPSVSLQSTLQSTLIGQHPRAATDQITMEDLRREKSGDVSPLPRPQQAQQPPRRQLQLLRKGGRVTHKAAVHVEQTVATQLPPKGPVQRHGVCLNFAQWVKGQNVQGPAFVHIWKSTCQPAISAGSATETYEAMCAALGGAVQKFADQDWQPNDVCESILQVFHESGVGASPLMG